MCLYRHITESTFGRSGYNQVNQHVSFL